ncbi:MAG: MBL fold metallo-hydrolase, partial [Xanthobacteraceae bacterium]
MTMPIALNDITIHPIIEQQGVFFNVMGFFPDLTREVLDENRPWLQPEFVDAAGGLLLCIQIFVIKTPHHNILVDACVGNHKP